MRSILARLRRQMWASSKATSKLETTWPRGIIRWAVGLQIVSIFAGTKGLLDRMAVSAIGAFEPFLHTEVSENAADTLQNITDTGKLSEEDAAALTAAIKTAVERFMKEHPEASLGEH